MASIILDCDLMRYPHSGLYHYCLNVGISVNKQLEKAGVLPMKMYVPPAQQNAFPDTALTIAERGWHKLWKPFLHNCTLWHAPFQSGRIIPDKKRYPNIRVLLTIHDLNALHEGKHIEEQRKSLSHTQSLIGKSDAIVCISEFTRKDVLEHCITGNKPVYVIHNGIHQLHTEQLTTISRKADRPFLFGMGYVNQKKNYHVLLPLLQHNPGIDLIIAGKLDEPDYVAAIKREAARLGVADQLRLTGPVSEGEKSWYYHNCLAFVHPSLAEGFGATVVEAMHFGKPLFLSDRTALSEIGSDVAFYFSSFEGEYMQKVFQEGMRQYRVTDMPAAVINRGKYFNWEKSAARYIDVYQSLL